MNSQLTLNDELRKLVEARLEHTLKGVEDTLRRILENQEMSLKNLKKTIQSLEESFNLLSKKWNLEILYILFLKDTVGFSGLKKILGVNSHVIGQAEKPKTTRVHRKNGGTRATLKSKIFSYNKRKEHRAACITLVILFKQFNLASNSTQNIILVKRVPSPFVPHSISVR